MPDRRDSRPTKEFGSKGASWLVSAQSCSGKFKLATSSWKLTIVNARADILYYLNSVKCASVRVERIRVPVGSFGNNQDPSSTTSSNPVSTLVGDCLELPIVWLSIGLSNSSEKSCSIIQSLAHACHWRTVGCCASAERAALSLPGSPEESERCESTSICSQPQRRNPPCTSMGCAHPRLPLCRARCDPQRRSALHRSQRR